MMFVKPVYPLFTQDNNNTIIHFLFFPYSALARDTANDETDLHTTDCGGYNNNNSTYNKLYPIPSSSIYAQSMTVRGIVLRYR